MKNFTFSAILFVFGSFCAVPNIGFSQNDSIDKSLENQLLKMQQQMMENLKKHGFSDGNFSFMGDTTFFFKIDTSFYGETDEFFQQSPRGQQDIESGFPDFDQLIQRFFDLSEKGSNGDGSEYLDPEGDNELLPNHGCAVQANIAAMTAYPQDLVKLRRMSRAPAESRVAAVKALSGAAAASSSAAPAAASASPAP